VGSVGATGLSRGSGGSFTLSGAGADVWDTADAFHFTYQNLTGDGTITARVASVQNVHAWTKAGVMIRASLSPASAHAFMLVSPGKGIAFQRRPSDGALSVHTAGSFTTAPRWVRITRNGNTILAFESADGTAWTLVGSSTIALGATVHVGLAVSSHVHGTVAEAAFDNVSVKTTTAAAEWASGDIGAVGRPGHATINGASMAVAGSGLDIWGTADQFHYVHQPLTGDGSIVARVTSIQNSHVWVKAGVMIRETLAANSAQALMLVTPGGTKGLAFQRRIATGGISASTSGGEGTAPSWVRLVRRGNTITASRSDDGVTWTTIGSETFSMAATVYVGIAVTSHDNAVLASATFENVAVGR
jgi:regulation of enolase protein 1 (concanavalin A-like superfamily)